MPKDAALHFNAAVRRDVAAAREQWFRLLEAFSSRGITFGGAPMPTFLRPQFVDHDTWATLTSSATRLVRLAERVRQTVFGGSLEKLLDFLGAPEAHRRLLPDIGLSRRNQQEVTDRNMP